jgi:hypothetical protein
MAGDPLTRLAINYVGIYMWRLAGQQPAGRGWRGRPCHAGPLKHLAINYMGSYMGRLAWRNQLGANGLLSSTRGNSKVVKFQSGQIRWRGATSWAQMAGPSVSRKRSIALSQPEHTELARELPGGMGSLAGPSRRLYLAKAPSTEPPHVWLWQDWIKPNGPEGEGQ